MRTPLTFFVAGFPAGQPRIKAARRGGFTSIYTPTTVTNKAGERKEHPALTWKKLVIAQATLVRPELKWTGPLRVNLTFWFPRPKSHYRSNGELKLGAPKWHTSKPDRDNCEKLICDSLTQAGIWEDDMLVCDGRIKKFYAPQSTTGVSIEIMEATEL